jgi:hypothetical protein
MKFYDCTTAPSPRRVRIFLAEKGISVPTVQVDLRNGEQFSPAFRAINPDCTVPVLELDNGTRIADIVAICRYFEELYPKPRLMGRTAEEKAVIEAWQRRVERDGFYAAMEAFRNSTPGLKGRALPGSESYDQIPALAERGRAEFVAYAKKNPGKVNHATGGTATLLATELLKAITGIEIGHVSYRGGAPAVTGLMSGDVEVAIADIATANAALQSDRVRPLAVTTLTRVSQYPEIPTGSEAGVPGYDVATRVGAFAPAGTPKDVVDKIEAGIKDALKEPDVRAKLEQIGIQVRSGTAEEMRDVLAKDIAKWGSLVREKNIKIAQ